MATKSRHDVSRSNATYDNTTTSRRGHLRGGDLFVKSSAIETLEVHANGAAQCEEKILRTELAHCMLFPHQPSDRYAIV